MTRIFPNTASTDQTTVTATSAQFSVTLANGETHMFVSSTNCWIQQGTNPTATAADTSPLVVADDVLEAVNTTTNALQFTAHGLLTGDGPIRFTTDNALPGGLAVLTDFWIVKVDADNVKVATSRYNAMHGTVVDITSAGAGTNTLVDTADTTRAGSMFVPASTPILITGNMGATLAVLRDSADGKASLTRCAVY